MTRLFLADGTHVPVTVLKLDGCAVVATRTAGEGRLHRRSTRFGFRQAQERHQGRPRPVRQGRDRASPQGRGIPRRCRQSARCRRSASGRSFRARPEGGRHRRHHRPRLYRRDEALEFPRSGSQPRRFDQPSLPGRHRRSPGSGQDLQEQEDARPLRRRQRHHPESGSGQGRCRTRPDHGARRGAGLQGRLGHGARCRQEAAQGSAVARLGQEARRSGRAAPAAPKKRARAES